MMCLSRFCIDEEQLPIKGPYVRILECFTHTQSSATQSCAIQTSIAAPHVERWSWTITHGPWKVTEEREPATREVNLPNMFLLNVCAEFLRLIPSCYVADMCIFFS